MTTPSAAPAETPLRVETCSCCQKPVVPIYGNEYSEPTMCGSCESFMLDMLITQHTTDTTPVLLKACIAAKAHIEELREAWRSGALRETDGKGGERSNRNVDVDVLLRQAIARAEGRTNG